MIHIKWLGFNSFLLFLVFVVSSIAFSYFITAEDYITHSAGFVDVPLNPTKDAILFTAFQVTAAVLYILLSRYQIGTLVSKAIISILIILLQLIFLLYGLVLFEAVFPLTVMRSVVNVTGVVVIIMSSMDIVKYAKRVNKVKLKRVPNI
ncbi:hypothetical protein [Paenibacillus agilis]|uniref:Uncharacterized protein n=1 Tax=Paenibacillus agilis TaxID=3020863 RepID=A0A559J1M4_9BACL|nr:hypothetical protein [Paenibacillus agilis]TVX93782.1 hypothetical protein FPZ44_12385 [Paenibacillus agilis]